jgi:hypothetical protein
MWTGLRTKIIRFGDSVGVDSRESTGQLSSKQVWNVDKSTLHQVEQFRRLLLCPKKL